MSRIDITTSAAPLSDGMLQTANPLDATLQVVTDNVGNSSTVSLSTTETQINSILRIKTDNAELLDIESSTGNRFNINRVSQNINLDFASKPTDITTQVGAIRTAIDGTNLADVVKFQENGQVTFTERVKLESDSTVTTQTSSVIQSSTLNANLVIAPNGTGALIAQIPDGTTVGGNARGSYALDLQRVRTAANQVMVSPYGVLLNGQNNKTNGSNYETIINGLTNFVNCPYGTILNGTNNTVNYGTANTIINGSGNTVNGNYSIASGINCTSTQYSVALGFQNTASGSNSFVIGDSNVASGGNSVCFGFQNTASGLSSMISGYRGTAYLLSQTTIGNTPQSWGTPYYGLSQSSNLVSCKLDTLTTAATTVLSLDGTGVTNLLIPSGNNRAWNVQVNWVAVVTTITGTATGISVGDVVTSIDLLAFKKIGGVSSASAHTSTATKTMVTTPAAYAACAIAFTAGASQEMALTFTGPTFVGGGSVTMRVVATVELTEVAF